MKKAEKVCIVTGGSSGVGLSACEKFNAMGYQIVTCGRNEKKLEEAKKRIDYFGRPCSVECLDVCNTNELTGWLQKTYKEYGNIDVLINNAGAAPLSRITDFDEREFLAAMQINCNAVFLTTKTVMPIMKEQGGGTIINISSLASVDPFPGFSVYGACKAWVNLFTKASADEGKQDNIHVYSVALGAVETPLLRGLFAEFPEEQALVPGDVANYLYYLTSVDARPLSGTTVFYRK